MNRLFVTILLAMFLQPAFARDEHNTYRIHDVLTSHEGEAKLDKSIRLYFGKQPHPPISKSFGQWGTNKKSNGFGRSDKVACDRALLSALIELQQRARKQGGNAVIGIRSNYKKMAWSSETEYMCGSGALMSGVALKGTVVSLRK